MGNHGEYLHVKLGVGEGDIWHERLGFGGREQYIM